MRLAGCMAFNGYQMNEFMIRRLGCLTFAQLQAAMMSVDHPGLLRGCLSPLPLLRKNQGPGRTEMAYPDSNYVI